jgi:hypothetical protein
VVTGGGNRKDQIGFGQVNTGQFDFLEEIESSQIDLYIDFFSF